MMKIKRTDSVNNLTPGHAVCFKTRRRGNFRARAVSALSMASERHVAGMAHALSEHLLKMAGIMGLQQRRLARQVLVPQP